ncbi:MAG TPA: glycosyltransferase family 39 protein [Solirubrobacteraceae bacterium]
MSLRALGVRRAHLAALLAILAAFLATRLSMYDRLPYLGDEALHGQFSQKIAHSVGKAFISLTIAKEPLELWFGAVWIKLGLSPLHAIRVVSVLAGLVTLVMVGLLARRLAGAGAALATMGLYALLPFFVVHDVIGIMDPLLVATTVTALYLQLELSERPRAITAVGLGLAMAAAILTKESGKVAVALLPLSLLAFDWSAGDRRARLLRWGGCALLALAFAAGGYALLRSSSLYGHVHGIRSNPLLYPVRPLSDALHHPWSIARRSLPVYRTALLAYVTIPVLVAGAAGLVVLAREYPRRAVLLCVWIAGPFAAAVLLPYNPYARHILFAMPPGVVLAGIGLGRGGALVTGRLGDGARGRLAVGVALLALMTPALLLDGRILSDPARAHYPGPDDYQYVTGISGGSIWPAVTAEVRRLSRGRSSTTVVRMQAATEVLELMLHDPRVHFVYANQPAAQRATIVVRDIVPFGDVNANALLARRGAGAFRLVATFTRPRGSGAVRVYARPG